MELVAIWNLQHAEVLAIPKRLKFKNGKSVVVWKTEDDEVVHVWELRFRPKAIIHLEKVSGDRALVWHNK